ncbi:MAG TPA: TetR/AcrR family transcriptional regulator C-terminal domain-containing protein [Cellulomonas sp.]
MSPRAARLSRESIIATALQITARSDRGDGLPLTGRTLGDALGVDRSAVWRHFTDKDDLLLAVADELLAPVSAAIDADAPPAARLRTVWDETYRSFSAHPRVAAELICRSITGPQAMTVIDAVVGAFRALGLDPGRSALAYRAFIDMLLSYAAMESAYSLLTPEQRDRDDTETEVALRRLDPGSHPDARSAVEEIVAVRSDDVRELLLASFLRGVLTA